MKFTLYSIIAFLVLGSCTRIPIQADSKTTGFVQFNLDLNEIRNDTFKVEMILPELSSENNIYQFASTAPGTYQVMDLGRFVSDFKAYDAKGKEVPSSRISVNQYRLTKPAAIDRITYKMAETWDTPVDEKSIYRMCGTSIENDHILINPHAVLGYVKGAQSLPIELKLEYPDGWKVGTPLTLSANGTYSAKSFDHLVDSPFLLGELSTASTKMDGTDIEIYTYSRTGMIESEMIMESIKDLLIAANTFLGGLPVDRYAFLFHFDDMTHGAWEHSYSSTYINHEGNWEDLQELVLSTAAHEFFHIVTPLNIHSEVIESFDFVTPQPSDHLWLYEAVTEWASDMILLHGDNINAEEYFDGIEEKLFIDDLMFSKEYSMVDLARTSFTEEGHAQYINIYNRGAVIASLLDLKILKLSNGERGLRDLIIELMEAYGPDKPFSEKDFFNEITERTYPEIESFINDYIKKNKELPLEAYYDWIGVKYETNVKYPDISDLGLTLYPTGEGHYIYLDPKPSDNLPVKKGDFIMTINDHPFTSTSRDSMMTVIREMTVGTEYNVMFIRDGQPQNAVAKTVPDEDKFLMTLIEDPTEAQLYLRQRWLDGTYTD
ncbi:MAG: peptidase [Bacteroidetes bacterium]|nr:peptidase [Bacteroidota bacterium]